MFERAASAAHSAGLTRADACAHEIVALDLEIASTEQRSQAGEVYEGGLMHSSKASCRALFTGSIVVSDGARGGAQKYHNLGRLASVAFVKAAAEIVISCLVVLGLFQTPDSERLGCKQK
jgi:hypothetical protein